MPVQVAGLAGDLVVGLVAVRAGDLVAGQAEDLVAGLVAVQVGDLVAGQAGDLVGTWAVLWVSVRVAAWSRYLSAEGEGLARFA